MRHLTAITWVYRAQKERFVALVQAYLETARVEAEGADSTGLLAAVNAAAAFFQQHLDISTYLDAALSLATSLSLQTLRRC